MGVWRCVYVATLVLALVVGLGLWNPFSPATAKSNQVPRYIVDPFWPKPLPSDPASRKPWVTGEVGGTCVDSKDHVFTVNRAFQNGLVAPETVIEVASPPIIEYDRDGNVVNAWGNPAILPTSIHGCFVDYQDNVWIAGNGDGIVQKYTHDGSTLLLQIGTKGVCDWPANNNACGNSGSDPTANQSKTLLNEPADIAVDPANGDVYIADGYGNHRIVVFDKSGNFLRQWGRQGTKDESAAGDGGAFMGVVHCVVMDNSGLVYVCDRQGNRIQVFDKMGNFKKNIWIKSGHEETPDSWGTAWWLRFSRDPAQKFMYVADGRNELVHILDRESGTEITKFGLPGPQNEEFK